MRAVGPVTGVRRTYNKWVADETLEDFALRFTARRARRWSVWRVANTAIGSISFLALEAIGGALTLAYGFDNALIAILFAGLILFLTALPISYHAAKAGVDVDLLTRGAGFGYLGSTITSLIYAGFTFIFFALEAAILSQAFELCFGLPIYVGYLVNALLVIPLVTHGFTRIGAFQTWTQPIWAPLQILPFLALIAVADFDPWLSHQGREGDGGFDLVLCASAAGIALSLIAQIGEQVDFLRFLPEPKTKGERRSWWAALLCAGPGWAVVGTLKMLAGSWLAVMILEAGAAPEQAVEPTRMYLALFEGAVGPEAALVVTAVFVILSQLKINVTNAYAGSIAWSNFFSRLTHSHPGRVVWLIFNVAIALFLMEFGVFGALESVLAAYAHVALAWIGAVTGDLVVALPLGLRPKRIEFRRGHLWDLNPVGAGATLLALVVAFAQWFGAFGADAAAFSSLAALAVAFVAAPVIAWATGGRYYLVRPETAPATGRCVICENRFDPEDMVQCPFHSGAVCSLCCTLETGCRDACRKTATAEVQLLALARRALPRRASSLLVSRVGGFALFAGVFTLLIGAIFLIVHQAVSLKAPGAADVAGHALLLAFGLMAVMVGVVAWLYTLSNESRDLARRESDIREARLQAEIAAHEQTDIALQQAKEAAEAANEAKSRYLVGVTHELRTPLNAILGYAQLLETDPSIPTRRRGAVRVIRRSSEHMAGLIEGLLDISRIEAGRLEITREEIDLPDLLEQLCAIFEMEAQDKGLRFVADIPDDLPAFVHGDSKRLRQILINLLSNAIRYTTAGEVRLTVRFRNDTARFTVADTGRGIARADQERIFKPFERIEDPHAPVPGTGLGLTITRLLVEILGGELTLESAPGRGARFDAVLHMSRTGRVRAAARSRRRRGYEGPRRRILVCDDDAEHRRLVEALLAPLGFEIAAAESGEVALTLCTPEAPDLVLVDEAMPGMRGAEFCEAVRRAGMTMPLVLVSAHADVVGAGESGDFGPDARLPKPVDVEALLDLIGRLLGLTWTHDAPPPPPPVAEGPLTAPAETLEGLRAALSIGHAAGARCILDSLPETPFARRGLALVEALDLAGLNRLIEEARDDDDP